MLAYLLQRPTLLESIRNETSAALLPSGQVSLSQLSTACPRLHALFSEVLRIGSASSSIRIVAEPVTLGGKRFRPGARIVCPFRELHFDPTVYGPDPTLFDPERFIRDKTLTRSSSYRPFGGGLSYCPGRFIARQEVNVFIALALHRFDIGLVAGQNFPVMEVEKPTTGIAGPVDGNDLLINVSVRC